MPVKLAFRNIKRQTSAYVIYFITVVFTVALMFAANNVLFAEELWAYNKFVNKDAMLMLFSVIIALVVFVVGFIIIYATVFLLRKRKKELGTYLLLGIKKSSVITIFVLENAVIGVVSFLLGCVLGVGVFQILNVIICAIIGKGLRPLTLSAVGIPVTLLQWAGILFVALTICAFKLKFTKIGDLIRTKEDGKKLPKLPLLEKLIALVMFGAICASAVFIVVTLYLAFEKTLFSFAYIAIPVAAAVLVVAIFFFYLFLRSLYFRKLKYKKIEIEKTCSAGNTIAPSDGGDTAAPSARKKAVAASISYNGNALKGANIFYYRQMSSSMNRNAAIMGIIAVLLSLSVVFTNFTFGMRFIMTENVRRPFDVYGSWSAESVKSGDFGTPEEVIAEAKKYSEINFSYVYDTYEPDIYDPDDETTFWSQSFSVLALNDFNTAADALGQKRYELAENEIAILSWRNDTGIEVGDTLELYGNSLVCRAIEENETANAINESYCLLVPDAVITTQVRSELFKERKLLLNSKGYLPDAFSAKFIFDSYYSDSSYHYTFSPIDNSFDRIDDINFQFSVAIVSAVFISVTFMLMAMALLSLKVMADADRNKQRYAILNMLGVATGRQRKLMFRQLLVFFIAPLFIPLLIVIPSVLANAIMCVNTLGLVHPAIFGIGFAVPLVYLGIYLCYFAAAYYLSVKNCIKPMEKARLKVLESQ